MESNSAIRDRLENFISIKLERKEFLLITVSTVGYLVWLFSFPLFGPVMASYLEGMRALAIEKGRVVQIFLAAMCISSLGSGYLIDRTGKDWYFCGGLLWLHRS